jgi:hypothetical protein
MPRFLLAALLLLSSAASFAQPDPNHPDLCQGAYYTEAQGAQVLHDLPPPFPRNHGSALSSSMKRRQESWVSKSQRLTI